MKKLLKVFVGLIIIFVLLEILYLNIGNMAGVVGKLQNGREAETSISEPTITYIGDSLTNGYNSVGSLVADNTGYRGIIDTKLNANSTNFAVGGYTSYDVLEQLEADTSVNEVNQIIQSKVGNDQELLEQYAPYEDDITLSESIKNSDYVIATIGANDIISELLVFNDDGSFTVDFSNLNEKLNAIRDRKLDIYSQIHEINPDVQIIDVGIYFAYPHISDRFTALLYPVLMYVEHVVFINDNDLNVHKVTIRDNMQADIKEYIDNPDDIHPNISGYEIMANEIIKAMDENQPIN